MLVPFLPSLLHLPKCESMHCALIPWFMQNFLQGKRWQSESEVWFSEKIWAHIKDSKLAWKSVGPYNDWAAEGPLPDEQGWAEQPN